MEIFLLRHGIAVEREGFEPKNDFARPLTAKGKKQLRHVSAAMKQWKLKFDLIVASPFLRTKETAAIIATDLKLKRRVTFSNALTPENGVQPFLRELQKLKPAPPQILVVGHEPLLGQLLSWLTTGDLELQMDFKKGGLAKLEVEKLSAGKCATLIWLLTPKQMKQIAVI